MKSIVLSLALFSLFYCFGAPAQTQYNGDQSAGTAKMVSGSGQGLWERFYSLCVSGERVTTSEFADYAMPNRGLHGSVRWHGSSSLDMSLDMFGYLQQIEGQFVNLWTSNAMVFIGPRFYLRRPENLSGVFVGAGIGAGWKSIIVDIETETSDYLALTGMVCLGFNLMFARHFGVEAAYYRSAELISADRFRYKQFTLGLTFGEPR